MRSLPVLAAIFAVVAGRAAAAEAPPARQEPPGSSEGWTVHGSFRIRDEAIAGQFRPAPAPQSDHFLSLRTALLAEYRHGPLRLGGELFDSRGYLERPNSSVSTAEVNALELGQAYLAWDYGAAGDAVTVGRFTMDDGSRRLIARNLFRNTINAFTGVRLDWRDGDDQARLFWATPQIREPEDAEGIRANRIRWDHESLDQQFFGGSYAHALGGGATFEIYGYGLTERDSPGLPTRNRRLFTPGVRVHRSPKPGRLDYEIEAIYQTGRERRSAEPTDLQDLQVSAYFVHAEVGWTFGTAWSPRIALQYDQASGNDERSGHYGRFDTLFGARRGEYGPTSLWGAVQRANLRSPGVRVEVRPDRRWDGFAAVRGLWLDSPTDSFAATGVQDPSGRSGRFAGEQAEVRARYWLVPDAVRLEAGTAWLFKGRFLKDAPNAPKDGDSRYAYVDVTYRF